MIHPLRQRQNESKVLAGGQRKSLLERLGPLAGIRRKLNVKSGKRDTLKPVKFPALIPHHQVHGLPGPYVNSIRRESEIVNDDPHLLILGGTGAEAKPEDHQGFDHAQAPC